LEALPALDEEFHRLIIERSGFPRVWRLVRSTRDHLQRLRNLMVPALGTAAGSVRFHREIVEGLASGDADRAEQRMRMHQDAIFRYSQELMRRMPDYFEGPIQDFLDIPPPWSPNGRDPGGAPDAPRAGEGRTPRQ
jgi:DNA-binding GntR family transcriptional regulator